MPTCAKLLNILVLSVATTMAPIAAAGTGDFEVFEVTNGNNSGPGSLRDAVSQAEASSSPVDKYITIDPAVVPTITLTTGPIEISDPRIVQILGLGFTPNVIDAAQTSRLFVITSPDSMLEFRSLLLRNGQTTADAGPVASCAPGTGRGGAICSLGAVTLNQVSLADNRTLGDGAHGGAVYASGAVVLSEFCISTEQCRYSNNTTSGAGAHGGAIYSESMLVIERGRLAENHVFVQNHALGRGSRGGAVHVPRALIQQGGGGLGGSVTLDRTTVRFVENSADTGGAMLLDCVSAPNVQSTVEQVDFADNLAERAGGAITATNQCRLRLSSAVFERNRCLETGGGAVFSDDEVELRAVRMVDNECAGPGGAIFGADVRLMRDNALIGNSTTGAGHHGGAVAAGELLMRDSTVSGNQTFGREANGGGLWVFGSFDIGNSTISQNVADDGDASRGGGIFYSGSGQNLVINSSTMLENAAADGGDGIFISGDPVGSTIGLSLGSTVLAGNGSDNLQVEGIGVGSLIDVVQSVFGDGSSEISGLNVANVLANDPELGPLADNGCRAAAGNWAQRACAESHAPLPMSLVIDAGDNPGGFASDQRGFTYPRTFGAASDIGAIEVNPDPSVSVVPSMLDFGTVIAGDIESLPLTVSNDGPGVLFFEGVSASVSGTNVELGDCEDAVLLAGQSCEMTVETSPFPSGEINDTIEILSDDPQSPAVVPVRIFAVTGAELVLDRATIDFGDLPVGMTSPVETLVLENVGVRPLNIFDISVTGDGFALLGDDCGAELAPGADCAAEIQFTPGSTGVAVGTLEIRTNSIVNEANTEVGLAGSSGVIFADGFEG